VTDLLVITVLEEILDRERRVGVDISVELGDHAEIVDEEGVLVDMLEDAEVAISEGQLESVLEVLVSLYDSSLLGLAQNSGAVDDLYA
jgi:hypothetical protein